MAIINLKCKKKPKRKKQVMSSTRYYITDTCVSSTGLGFGYVSASFWASFIVFSYITFLRFTINLLYSRIRQRRLREYNIVKCPPEGDPPLAEKLQILNCKFSCNTQFGYNIAQLFCLINLNIII